jgi:signal transduction histidine kinase
VRQSTAVRDSAAKALAIAASALKYENLTDFTQILRQIGQATGSFAVLLWELAPGVNPQDESQIGQLFVLADWLESGDHFASHTLPLRSLTGTAILGQETRVCKNVVEDRRVHREPSDFFERHGIRSFVSIPLRFGDSERGALNLYRVGEIPMSDTAVATAEALATVLPGIWSALHEKSSLKIMGTVNGIIQKHEGLPNRFQLSSVKEALEEMARAISEGFRSLEASIFLIQTDIEPRKARLQATTFRGYIRQEEYSIDATGLTGWVLKRRAPLRVFDLQFYDRDRHLIEARYPGLSGYKIARLREITRTALNLEEGVPLHPLSFLAVPILVGEDLLGVIRCCTPLGAPYYYSERDERLLTLVASQVGHFWNNWVQLGAIENENRSWVSLVTSLNELIRRVSSQEELEERAILRQFLRLAHDVIPGAEIFDVRLHDAKGNDLYFAATEGEAWDENALELTKKRFPLDGKSAGAWVFKHKKIRTMPDVEKESLYDMTFPEVKSMVIAPVSSGGEQYGVLDVRITNSMGIPPNAPTIAEALGQQLGLYLHLSRALRKVGAVERTLRQNVSRLELAEDEREKVLKIQTRVFEDLEHQLKLPILQAHSRLSAVLAKTLSPNRVVSNVQAVRGLLRKAERVVRGMGMFVTLARDETLKRRLTRLNKGPLVKLLIEICMDCIFLEGHTSRGLRFYVEDETFDVLDSVQVNCDFELLEQVVYDIVDNACKYSFSNQQILVRGGLTPERCFYIAVINKGLPLLQEDIPHVTQRGWRGRNALLATGQGSGIGCWFADQVMRAHGGRLKLFPTNSSKLTEVRLQFG